MGDVNRVKTAHGKDCDHEKIHGSLRVTCNCHWPAETILHGKNCCIIPVGYFDLDWILWGIHFYVVCYCARHHAQALRN